MSEELVRRNFLMAAAAAAGIMIVGTEKTSAQGASSSQQTIRAKAMEKGTAPQEIQQLNSLLNNAPKIPDGTTPSVGSANIPIPRKGQNDTAFNKIIKQAREQFPLNEDLTAPLDAKFLSLDQSLQTVPVASRDDFRYFHVELLLDQAAQLLEHGIRDRTDWDEMSIRAFNLRLELEEFARLDEIHERETAAGFYALQYRESLADLEAERATSAGNSSVLYWINKLLTTYYSPNTIQEQSGFSQLTAWISGYPTFSKDFSGELQNFTWNQTTKKKPEHLKDAAIGQSFHALYAHQLTLYLQQAAYRQMHASSDRKIKGKQARHDWEKADMQLRRDRTEVSRSLNDIKYKAATDAKGTLNYGEKMEPIQERFQQAFGEAVARMQVARDGLKLLYGYPESHLALPAPTSPKYFDECLMWVRKAVYFMTRFAQSDQNYVLAISLRRLANNDDWTSHIVNGKWDFEITEALFPQQRHVRLRGMSASIIGETQKGVWQATITPPRASSCHHLSNQRVSLNQNMVPSCRLGRIEALDSTRAPDVIGISSLHNVSPFGTWHIALSPVSTVGSRARTLDDILLNLHLAVRSVE